MLLDLAFFKPRRPRSYQTNGVRLSHVHTRKLSLVQISLITYDFNLFCKWELKRKELFKANFSSFLSNFKTACSRYSIAPWFDVGFNRNQEPVSRKSLKFFGPVKPFLVHVYLKTRMCIRLKLLVWRKPGSVYITEDMWIKQLCNGKVRVMLWLYGPESFQGFRETGPAYSETSRERPPKTSSLGGCLRELTPY